VRLGTAENRLAAVPEIAVTKGEPGDWVSPLRYTAIPSGFKVFALQQPDLVLGAKQPPTRDGSVPEDRGGGGKKTQCSREGDGNAI